MAEQFPLLYSMIIYYCEFLKRYFKGSNIHGEFKTTILCVHKLLNINVLADNFVCTVVIYLGIRLKIVVKHLISLVKSAKKLNYTVPCILNKINYTFSLVIIVYCCSVSLKIRKGNHNNYLYINADKVFTTCTKSCTYLIEVIKN